MKIGIIGAGRMATGLAKLFSQPEIRHNCRVVGIYNRTEEKAKVLAKKIGSQAMTLAELKETCNLLFILTSDSAIEETAGLLAQLDSAENKQEAKTIIHCSGLLTSSVLNPLVAQGWQAVSLHPLQSVADREDAYQALKECWYSIEGTQQGVNIVMKLIQLFGAKVIAIEPEQKALYHAAACVISNYVTTLIHAGVELIKDAGFEQEAGRQALWPLLLGTINNIEKLDPGQALTGPVARGDWTTVRTHMDKLAVSGSPYRELYQVLAKYTAELAQAQGNISQEQKQVLVKEVLNTGGREKNENY